MKLRSLGEKEWIDTLMAPRTKIVLDLGGYHSRFTPAPDWDMGVRRIAEHLIYFIAQGHCTVVVEGQRKRASAGSLCWMCPGTLYRFFVGPRDTPPVIYRFRFNVCNKREAFRPDWRHRVVPDAGLLLDTIRQIIMEAEWPGKFSSLRVRNLLSLLSIAVLETFPSRRGTVLRDTQRAEISAFLSPDVSTRRSPSELARHLGFSATYFARIFRRTYGISPRAWILRQRLMHASVLLRESNSRVSEIADMLGYSDVYVLSRQFRQMFGVSPRQWRNGVA